jgi:hypothetical protein
VLVKLNITVIYAGNRDDLHPGDVASLPEHEARRLIQDGHAEEIPITLADLVE